ncbi:cAMP-binding domain of CRP or a regulatory subunit of cAMP-dependent protein kinases [Chitinophaga sp. YR573]|uniref:Crp/Fnr family transcriptional regulator n=1 Tax=Chitinophaga sp. YR573 TaxID=1881040 RepID=UPI0008B380F1|nr:Crp/Fnr family transcriptional regulator [Chitinophaga sp. YR573]SEV99428.1 cAMP-binding domain of CRP or a regulatory subunit of cAMP-dependent protein kinases [Chitinophaga sp. YR573]
MSEIKLVEKALQKLTGMDEKEFALSLPFWQVKQYKKGEYYNEYKNVCKHLGFVINGIFRTYYMNEATGEEKNMLFYTDHQIVSAYKSFINQTPCNYYTESMVDSTILYIHINHLQELYEQSHQWERFGRYVAEIAFNLVMSHTEDFLFKTPEQRYVELLEVHPNIFNTIPLYHIASYLGIQGPSLSRIRKRMLNKG